MTVADGDPLCAVRGALPGKTVGLVVQLVRTLACHARGRGFESHPGRHYMYASVAQSVEQRTENPRVGGSIPPQGTIYNYMLLTTTNRGFGFNIYAGVAQR